MNHNQKILGYYNYTVILTYTGMLIGFAGIIFAFEGSVSRALFCLMAAGICDMFDGTVASTKVRTQKEKIFGIQIDSSCDLICFGVLPAVIVYSQNRGSHFVTSVCALYLLCALIRLSYFNVDEQERQQYSSSSREVYHGLPVTLSALFLPLIHGAVSLFSWSSMIAPTAALLAMAVLFLLPFPLKKPRLTGKICVILFKLLQKIGVFCLISWFLHTRVSKHMIPGYIKKHRIDMKPYNGQNYDSFASFFARKRIAPDYTADPNVLISPCDGWLSIYTVTEDLTIPMKGSVYTITDLIPDKEAADLFQGGLCLVFRLEASDYHHFCCFDDGLLVKTSFIPGQLHSVKPIVLQYIPVYRLNRRWWSILETKHFATAAQIEVGAVAVGDVSFSVENSWFQRGDEMGCFELAGSTILLLLNSHVREQLVFQKALLPAVNGEKEERICMGSTIGTLKSPMFHAERVQ